MLLAPLFYVCSSSFRPGHGFGTPSPALTRHLVTKNGTTFSGGKIEVLVFFVAVFYVFLGVGFKLRY